MSRAASLIAPCSSLKSKFTPSSRELAERELDSHLEPEGERRALVHERGDRHPPAVALPADDVLVGDARLLDEQLVELRLAGDLAQGTDLDGLLLHVHEEVGQSLVL